MFGETIYEAQKLSTEYHPAPQQAHVWELIEGIGQVLFSQYLWFIVVY